MKNQPVSTAAPEPDPAANTSPTTKPDASAPKKSSKVPLKEVTIRPNDELRLKILTIAHQTGRTAPAVLEMLLSQAAGLKIDCIVVRPQCGQDVGVTLARIEEEMKRLYCVIRDAKGAVSSRGSVEQRQAMEKIYGQTLELWAIAQSLAKATFYNQEELAKGRILFGRVSRFRDGATKEAAEESAKGAGGNTKKIEEAKRRCDEYTTCLHVLTRLGFSPEGVIS